MTDTLDSLRAERDEARDLYTRAEQQRCDALAIAEANLRRAEVAEAERDEALDALGHTVAWLQGWRVAREAEIARYRAALAPFAAAYRASLPVEHGGTADPSLRVTLADCAAAALALEGENH